MHDLLSDTEKKRKVILGVAASDSHAVANHLICHSLREFGFEVINLGTCTPVNEFVEAFRLNPEAEAVIIGSLNGHAYEDLRDLPLSRKSGSLPCPVVLGGNLSVGSQKKGMSVDRLYELGVDRILLDSAGLPALLDELHASWTPEPAAVSATP